MAFTDIEDSSALSERLRVGFEPLRAAHFQILRSALERWNGTEVSTAGDALFAVFVNAAAAVQWAVEVQTALQQHDWPVVGSTDGDSGQVRAQIRVRIGLHTGEPFLTEQGGRGDYFGPAVNRAARVSSAGHGAQTLLSDAAHSLVLHLVPPEIQFLDCGYHRLKGVGEDRLWQVQAPGLPQQFPPLNTLDPQRHNLPSPATPYLGREQDLREWLERLHDPVNRVLTLTGFGGLGKTRTALQLAELSTEAFPDGVWWVEAEEARNGDQLLNRIASALRLPPRTDITFGEAISRHLCERALLLVLDNLEQVEGAAREISAMLARAPKVRFLITSRRPLEIQAERVVELSPLAPGEAAQLFADRVRDRLHEFAITPENATDIDELCQRLDGVPLALELAASRIAMMSPRQMLQRLNERFKLLQRRAPDLPERQRALRAAVDWSYDLLNEEDRSLFGQLSVFASGFTIEDAEAVCESPDIFEGVAELRRQSLLRSETVEELQSKRFSMLNSLREYAREKLGLSGAAAETRERHARYFLEFGSERLARERTREEAEALRDLERNDDNLRAALEYALELDDRELSARLSLMLARAWDRRGFTADALQCVRAAVERMGGAGRANEALFAELLMELTWLLITQHESGAEPVAEEALQLFRKLNDAIGQARTEEFLGYGAVLAGDYSRARSHFDGALTLAAGSSGDRRIADVVRANVGNTYGLLECTDPNGNLEQATSHLEQALATRRQLGDRRGLAETLTNLGVLAYRNEAWSEARQRYAEALDHELALRNWAGVARSLHNLAEAADAQGETDSALRLAAAAERLMDQVRSPWLATAAALLESIGKGDVARIGIVRAAAHAVSEERLVNWAMSRDAEAGSAPASVS